jgi:type VI protein secretion system component Hcp
VEDTNLLVEGEGEPQDEDHNDEIIADEWEPEEAQDQFDEEEDATEDNTITYQASMIRLTLDNIAAASPLL